MNAITSPDIATPVPEAPFPSARAAWWTIAILFVASIVSVIDRGILSLVVDPVRHDLSLSDVQIGLLQGLAFGLFYATVGVPLGLIADRTSRLRLIALGILIWSLATMAGGFVHGFAGLFACRLLVGLGEATLGPAVVSLVADLFPPDRRGKPISVYLMGAAVGSGMSIGLTSMVLTAAANGRLASVPMIGHLAPWRATFVICGVIGLFVVALMATTREPLRRNAGGRVAALRPLRERWAFFRRNASVLAPLYLGFALCFVGAYGSAAWAPTMLTRGLGLRPAQVGMWLGPFIIGFSLTGPLIGGILVDRLSGRGQPMAKFTILMTAPFLAIPATLAVFAPGPIAAMFTVASSSAIYAVLGTTMFALFQAIMPADIRGTSIALFSVINTIIGATLGPLLIALVTTHVFADPTKVGYSIPLVVVPALVIGVALFALGRRAMDRQRRLGGEAATLLVETENRAAAQRAAR